jgi:hypothetical protein
VVAGQTVLLTGKKRVRSSKANVHYLRVLDQFIPSIVAEQTRIITSKYAANVPFGYNIDPNPWNDQRMKKLKRRHLR